MAKRIMHGVNVFIIRSQVDDSIKGERVFLNEQTARSLVSDYTLQGCNVYLDSTILPFVGKYVSQINIYRGFDYSYPGMHDVYHKSQLYPSTEQAKAGKEWEQLEQRVKSKPEDFNVYDNKICSREIFGGDWYYGDVMEGKVSAEVKRLKVVR